MTTPQTAGAPTLRQAVISLLRTIEYYRDLNEKGQEDLDSELGEKIRIVGEALSAPGGEVELPEPVVVGKDGIGNYAQFILGYKADQLRTYGDARADAAATPLLARIAELEQQLVKAQSTAQHEADVVDAAKERIAELERLNVSRMQANTQAHERIAELEAAGRPKPMTEAEIIQARRDSRIPASLKPYSETISLARAVEKHHGITDNDAMDNSGENG